MFGDPAQLPPIGRHIWQPALLKGFQIMLLKETVRQRNDKGFAELLSRVRLGEPTVDDIDALRSRVVTDAELRQIDVSSRGLILFPMRRQKDAMNDIELGKLPGSTRTYIADDVDSNNLPVPQNVREYIDQLESKNTLLPKCLPMKLGARVMLLRNRDVEHGWVNGKIAVVEAMGSDYIVIADPTEPRLRLIVHRVRQNIRPPSGNGTFYRRQFPLDLAYGVTVHKSQGQTLDVVAVSAECLYSSGQFYTAISRVRELDALYFMRFDPDTIFLAADIRKLLDWMDIADVLRDQSPETAKDADETTIPPMPEVSQITFRPQWKQPKVPTVGEVNNGDGVKTRPMPTSPAVPPPPPKRKRVQDNNNNKTPTATAIGDVSIREALQMVCMIPIDVPLDEYIRQMHTIVDRFPTTMDLMAEIAGRTGCTYDDARPDHRVDDRLTCRFYRAFAEEQGHVICTTGDNSCMFHAFSLLMYGHERFDQLFRWLCCVQFMLQSVYYDDDHNRLHLDYDSVPLLIHNTALAIQQQPEVYGGDVQRTWGGAAHLKAMSDIARRDVYVYMATVTVAPPHQDCWSMEDWQLMVDANATRGAWHTRYEPFDPIPRRQAITLLLSDAGTSAAHYSAILPLNSRIRMLRPNVVLPPPRHE